MPRTNFSRRFFQPAMACLTLLVVGILSCNQDSTPFGPQDAKAFESGISGTAKDFRDKPLSGALVTAIPSGATTVTAADGSFHLARLAPGTYGLSLAKGDYRDTIPVSRLMLGMLQGIDVGVLRMRYRFAAIKGVVEDSAGTRLPMAGVAVEDQDASSMAMTGGEFTLSKVEPGRVRLFTALSGVGYGTLELDLAADSVLRDVKIRILRRGGKVVGRIVDEREVAMPGVRVETVGGAIFDVTDAQGGFELTEVPGEGRVVLTLSKDEEILGTLTGVEVPEGGNADVRNVVVGKSTAGGAVVLPGMAMGVETDSVMTLVARSRLSDSSFHVLRYLWSTDGGILWDSTATNSWSFRPSSLGWKAGTHEVLVKMLDVEGDVSAEAIILVRLEAGPAPDTTDLLPPTISLLGRSRDTLLALGDTSTQRVYWRVVDDRGLTEVQIDGALAKLDSTGSTVWAGRIPAGGKVVRISALDHAGKTSRDSVVFRRASDSGTFGSAFSLDGVPSGSLPPVWTFNVGGYSAGANFPYSDGPASGTGGVVATSRASWNAPNALEVSLQAVEGTSGTAAEKTGVNFGASPGNRFIPGGTEISFRMRDSAVVSTGTWVLARGVVLVLSGGGSVMLWGSCQGDTGYCRDLGAPTIVDTTTALGSDGARWHRVVVPIPDSLNGRVTDVRFHAHMGVRGGVASVRIYLDQIEGLQVVQSPMPGRILNLAGISDTLGSRDTVRVFAEGNSTVSWSTDTGGWSPVPSTGIVLASSSMGVTSTMLHVRLQTQGMSDSVISRRVVVVPWRRGIAYGSAVDARDQSRYRTIVVGGREWMAENLRWKPDTSRDIWCPQGDTGRCASEGRLYGWRAAAGSGAGICPDGWLLPTDGDWGQLEMAMGMSETEVYGTNWRGTDQGTRLRSATGWAAPGNGVDEIGFFGWPAGYRDIDGRYLVHDSGAGWWSATSQGADSAWARYVNLWGGGVVRSAYPVGMGLSVRCVRSVPQPVMLYLMGAMRDTLWPLDTLRVYGDSAAKREVSLDGTSWTPLSGSTIVPWDLCGGTDCRLQVRATREGWKQNDWWRDFKFGTWNPNVSFSSVTDTTDGRRYRTVLVGDRTWMAENLRRPIAGSVSDPTGDGRYGRYYSHQEALAACPDGWHLPTRKDWEVVYAKAEGYGAGLGSEGDVLKSPWGWPTASAAGDDRLGFRVLPGGALLVGSSLPASVGEAAMFWASDSNGSMALHTHMDSSGGHFFQERSRLDRLPVRCIANLPDTVMVSVLNPGFESGSSEGWLLEVGDTSTKAYIQAVVDSTAEGKWMARVVADSTTDWGVRLVLPPVDVVAGASYRVRFWLDGAGPIGARVLDIQDRSTPLWSGELWPTAGWHEMDIAFSSGTVSGFERISIELDMGRTAGVKRIDNLRIEYVK